MTRRALWGVLVVALGVWGTPSYAAQPVAAPVSAPAPASAQPTQGQAAPAVPALVGYSAAALYNLANSYARAGKPGFAVLNYERARLLDPSDPDIEANLNHVREASGLPPESLNRFERIAGIADPQVLAWLGVLGLLIAGMGALRWRFYPRHRRKFAVATLLGISLLGASVGNAIMLWPRLHQAVVITHTAPVRVSPALIEETLFVLPEAAIVGTGAEHDGFVLIRTDDGRTGWVPSTNLAAIVPPQRRGG